MKRFLSHKACGCLAQVVHRSHSSDFKENYPAAAMVLLRHMYIEDAVLVGKDFTKVLGGAGFRAQKWYSSGVEVLEKIPQEDRASWIKARRLRAFDCQDIGSLLDANKDFTLIVKEANLPLTRFEDC